MNANAITIRPDILLSSGAYFDLLRPWASPMQIEDIAHGLSHTCRFAGQCREFYSVAQHSVLASLIVPPEDALYALLHDASEAFIGDVSRPLKNLLPDYRKIESAIETAIYYRYGLNPQQVPESVKQADLILLATEQRDLMPAHDDQWALIAGVTPLTEVIDPQSPWVARTMFMERFRKLMAENPNYGVVA